MYISSWYISTFHEMSILKPAPLVLLCATRPHPAQRRGEDETEVALDDGAQLIKASLISSRSRGQKRSSEIWLDMVRSLRFPSFHTKNIKEQSKSF